MDDESKVLYRRCLSAYATGVAVVTVRDERGGVVGLTVNSFTSISLDPPLILWSLGNASDRGAFFREADRFAVNILGAEDADFAAACARRGNYCPDPARIEPGDPPLVKGALTRLKCFAVQRTPVADHLLIIAEVEAYETRDGDGLIYFRSRYGRAATIPRDA